MEETRPLKEVVEECIKAYLGPEKYLLYLLKKKEHEPWGRSPSGSITDDVLDFDFTREMQLLQEMGMMGGPWNREKWGK